MTALLAFVAVTLGPVAVILLGSGIVHDRKERQRIARVIGSAGEGRS